MLASALVLQAIVLSIGWFVTFRLVQRSFAQVVEGIVQQQNRDIVERVANLLPETMGEVEFGSEEWERFQRIIEGEALRDLPAGGFVCLVEPDGRLLCHPEIRENPGLRNFSFDGMQLANGLEEGEFTTPVLEVGMAGQPATGVLNFVDDLHFVGTQTIDGRGHRLLVHQPVGKVVRVGRDSTRWILLFAAGAAVGVLGISGLGLSMLLRRYEGVQERLNRQLRDNLLVAQRIQQATLPSELPSLPGYAFAGASMPAEETGGDTYDMIGLDGGTQVALLLADATGHGIGPALAIAQLQGMARLAWQHEQDPRRVAALLNARMHQSLPDGRFVTGWFGLLDSRDGTIQMVSAGQDPQLVYRAARGSVERLSTDTLPLGIMADLSPLESRSIALQPGDVLLVSTDGLAEARNSAAEQFGVGRIADVVQSAATQGPQAVADALIGAVRRFTENSQPEDDRTVLVVQRLADIARLSDGGADILTGSGA